MVPSDSVPTTRSSAILTADQRHACERLLTFVRVRAVTTAALLSTELLAHWSVPLLVGPAASGKEHICQEVARRLGGWPCRRWEAGSWITVTNRASGTTLEQIERFADTHPQGCLVYLAGIDTLGKAMTDHNLGYRQACASEIEQLLDWTASRPARFLRRDGTTFHPNVLVVVGGRFAALWGDHEFGKPSGTEAWRNADHEPLTDACAVSSWLTNHSGLPAGLQRRLAPEPCLLRRLDNEEADRLAEHLGRLLPPMLDGIGVHDLAEALRNTSGWRGVAHLLEQALVAGYEGPSTIDHPDTAEQFLSPAPSVVAPNPLPSSATTVVQPTRWEPPKEIARPARLAVRLGLSPHRSRLLPKLRRLGLPSGTHLEALAVARGYTLPGVPVAGEPSLFLAGAWQQEIRDVELAVALLSPGLEYNERTLCRGALMLRHLCQDLKPHWVARIGWEAKREQALVVVRHVALLGGGQGEPQAAHWRMLLSVLPEVSSPYPALPPGAMPDEAIRRTLTDVAT